MWTQVRAHLKDTKSPKSLLFSFAKLCSFKHWRRSLALERVHSENVTKIRLYAPYLFEKTRYGNISATNHAMWVFYMHHLEIYVPAWSLICVMSSLWILVSAKSQRQCWNKHNSAKKIVVISMTLRSRFGKFFQINLLIRHASLDFLTSFFFSEDISEIKG